MHNELSTAYEELQSSSEELETTNEELQSAVEELETTNEELQSTNEELETMNEELQSTNEELQTLNDELRERTHEVGQQRVPAGDRRGARAGRGRGRPRLARAAVERAAPSGSPGCATFEAEGQRVLDLQLDLPAAEACGRCCATSSSWAAARRADWPSPTGSATASGAPRCTPLRRQGDVQGAVLTITERPTDVRSADGPAAAPTGPHAVQPAGEADVGRGPGRGRQD